VVQDSTGTYSGQLRTFYLEPNGQLRWGITSRAALDVSLGRAGSGELWVGDGNATQNASGYIRAARLYAGPSTAYLGWNSIASLMETNTGFLVNGPFWVQGTQPAYMDSIASSGASTPITISPNAGYGLKLNTSGSKPTCDSTTRAQFFIVQASAGTKDTVEVCAKDAANAYAWRTIY
jgi:hypothetical protein